MLRSYTCVVLSISVFSLLISTGYAHGLCSWPRQRGLLATNDFKLPHIKEDAPADYCPHCLNGGGPGAIASHIPSKKWTPYEPTDPSFPFRDDHSMCGDPKGRNDHMSDGVFTTGHTIAVYEEEDFMDMEVQVNAHHNGFFEFFICSLDCCQEDDISETCFKKPGCCKKMMRVPHKSCESGYDRICGPVDLKYPGRWYLPPRDQETPEDNWYGGSNKKMRYALPKGMVCEKCVIHWSWTTANTCNPPGYADYNFPQKWDGIPGDGGSVGSINRQFATCGDSEAAFPEEFWSCSENIRIVPKNEGQSRTLQLYYNGQMNIEGPTDSNSDMLLPPAKEPNPGEGVGEEDDDENESDDDMGGSEEENEEAPDASPTSTPSPTKEPTPTSTPPPTEDPYIIGTGSNGNETNTGSKYDLTAFLQTFDTGTCVDGKGGLPYCQACINLGYGSRKCFWCTIENDGNEICLHMKPNER